MTVPHPTNDEQKKLWNGVAGTAWVDAQAVLDQMFRPFEEMLVAAVVAESASQVLDVGCGTGATTLAIAARVGPSGRAVGIDISEPMIAAAKARAERTSAPASFICADAATHGLEPASFDMIVSRFGVMFFEDPVAAFASLRRAARNGAALRLVTFRSATENPFMTTAERAAGPLLSNIPPRRPDAPGQFAFADEARVRHILEASGWRDIELDPIDAVCTFPTTELTGYLSRLGPLGRALHDLDEPARARIMEAVRPAFDRYVHGSEVRFDAACWMIRGRAG